MHQHNDSIELTYLLTSCHYVCIASSHETALTAAFASSAHDRLLGGGYLDATNLILPSRGELCVE